MRERSVSEYDAHAGNKRSPLVDGAVSMCEGLIDLVFGGVLRGDRAEAQREFDHQMQILRTLQELDTKK